MMDSYSKGTNCVSLKEEYALGLFKRYIMRWGSDKTLKLVADQFFWPCMRKEVAKFVEGCKTCQVSKGHATNAGLYMPSRRGD